MDSIKNIPSEFYYQLMVILLIFSGFYPQSDQREVSQASNNQAGANETLNCCLQLDPKRLYKGILTNISFPRARILNIEKINSLSRIHLYAEIGVDVESKPIYVTPTHGHFESTDNGNTWKQVKSLITFTTLPVSRWASTYDNISTANGKVLYRRFEPSGRYERSDNGGYTWTSPSFEFKENSTSARFQIIEIDPKNPHILYTQVIPSNGKEFNKFRQGVYKSIDGGETWSFFTDQVSWLSISPSNPSIMLGVKDRSSSAFFSGLDWFSYLSINSVNQLNPSDFKQERFSNKIKKSTDGGKSWELIDHTDIFDQAWNPIPPRQEETYREVYKIEKKEDIEKRLQSDFRPRFYQIVIDPTNSDVVFLVTSHGILRSLDGGKSWCLLKVGMPYFHNINSLVIDPISPNILYAGTEHDGFWRSTDQGCTWEKIEIFKRLVGK